MAILVSSRHFRSLTNQRTRLLTTEPGHTVYVLIDGGVGHNQLIESSPNRLVGSPAENVFRLPVPERYCAVLVTEDDSVH